MYFIEKEIPSADAKCRHNWIKDVLEDFVDSKYASAEVFNDGEWKDNNNMRHSLKNATERYNLPVEVLMRNGRVFLRRK